jgi:hypothetical protein
MRPAVGATPVSILSWIPFALALRESPQARRTKQTPP